MRYADVALTVLLLIVWQYSMPEAVDVQLFFQPAARAVLEGESPYIVEGFYNPAWVIWPLLPIAWMSTSWATLIIRAASLTGYLVASRHVGCNLCGRIALILSPPVLFGLMSGGFDGAVLAGVALSPWLGFIVLAIKPQLTLGALCLGYKRGYNWWPLLGLLLLTVALYGLPVVFVGELRQAHWSSSLWPLGLLVGIPMLVWGIARDQEDVALAASPFLAPYTSCAGYGGLMLLLAKRWPRMLLLIDGLLIAWGLLCLNK